MTADTERSLFVGEEGRWVPTDYARGPWDPDALHGGPVAALVARAAERCEPVEQMHVSRLTVELLRPVPLRPLEVTAAISRPGRKVQLVDVRVRSEGTDFAWGRALRIRRLAEDAGAQVSEYLREAASRPIDIPSPPGPEQGEVTEAIVQGYQAFHNSGAELRFVRGKFATKGPSTVWVRLAVPVVAGEEPSPAQRASAAADFGNGVSSVLDFHRWSFINPDLTVFLNRPPTGEWICLDASTHLGSPGIGLSECVLWDLEGPIGRSVQSLLVEPR